MTVNRIICVAPAAAKAQTDQRLSMIRYTKLGYVALNVSDVECERTWYESIIGLQFNGFGDSDELFFCTSSDRHNSRWNYRFRSGHKTSCETEIHATFRSHRLDLIPEYQRCKSLAIASKTSGDLSALLCVACATG
jgi:hypothetical protein